MAQSFEPLGSGVRVTGEVRVMEFDTVNGRTFVGGIFTQVDNAQSENIAWADSSGWHSFGKGTVGNMRAMEMFNGNLYVGGSFNSIDGNAIDNLASWDGTSWNQLGGGVTGTVLSLAYYDSALYVSGYISTVGGTMVNSIAKWDGSTWSSVGSGADQQGVYLKVLEDTLYVYGPFKNFNGMPADQIISFDGTNWVPQSVNDTNVIIQNITKFQGKLCASVYDNTIYKTELRIKNGNSWSLLTGNLNRASLCPLEVYEDTLYFFASYYSSGTTISLSKINPFGNIVTTQTILPDPTGIRLNWYYAEKFNNALYVGGCFHEIGGQFSGSVLKFQGGITTNPFIVSTGYVNGFYSAMAFGVFNDTSQGILYAGGRFEFAGDTMASNIASWDGSKWSAMGNGFRDLTDDVAVRSIIKYNNQIFAAGDFSLSGNIEVNNIARWNGTSWDSIGTGASNYIREMIIFNSELYVCGVFSSFNGLTGTKGIVKFDGVNWSNLSGLTNIGTSVTSVCTHNNQLVISGRFNFGGVIHKIAVYDGNTWSALSVFPGFDIYRLASVNGVLYASNEDSVYKYDSTWVAIFPQNNNGYGYHPNPLNNQLLLGDNDANRTFMLKPDGTFIPFCYNILYETEPLDSVYTYVAGFLPNVYTNGHIINHIAKIKAANPSMQFSYSSDTICDHQYVYFALPPEDLIPQLEWTFPGGVPGISTAYSPAVKYSIPGDYDVYLKVSTALGSDSIFFPDLIHVENCTLGENEIHNSVGLFPNPTRDIITVRWTSSIQSPLMEIFDITGRATGISQQANQSATDLQMNCSLLPPGIYIVVLQTADRKYFKKFVKQ